MNCHQQKGQKKHSTDKLKGLILNYKDTGSTVLLLTARMYLELDTDTVLTSECKKNLSEENLYNKSNPVAKTCYIIINSVVFSLTHIQTFSYGKKW